MIPTSKIIYAALCALIVCVAQHEASLLSYPRKPILNYLVRYKLGHVKAKLHGVDPGHYDGYGHPHHPPAPWGLSGPGHLGLPPPGHGPLGLALTGPGIHGHGYGKGPFGLTGPGPTGPFGLHGKGIGHGPVGPLALTGPGPIGFHGPSYGKGYGHGAGPWGLKGLFHGHEGPTEEHIHHYYVEPFPVLAKPLAPPHVHPKEHLAHSYFSLQAPLLGTSVKYNHYWDLPKSSAPF